MSKEYPDIETSKFHFDAFAMNLIRFPEWFDVIVATSQMGDVLSDEAAALVGGLGIAPGHNLNPERSYPSMFEPIHGSRPRHSRQRA